MYTHHILEKSSRALMAPSLHRHWNISLRLSLTPLDLLATLPITFTYQPIPMPHHNHSFTQTYRHTHRHTHAHTHTHTHTKTHVVFKFLTDKWVKINCPINQIRPEDILSWFLRLIFTPQTSLYFYEGGYRPLNFKTLKVYS